MALIDSTFTGYEWYMILIYVVVVLGLVGLITYLCIHFSKGKIKNREEKKESEVYVQKTSQVAQIFGGKENIISIEIRGSRVVVNVKTTNGIDPKKLDQEGLKGSIIMGQKVMFPVGSQAEEFAKDLKNKIDE